MARCFGYLIVFALFPSFVGAENKFLDGHLPSDRHIGSAPAGLPPHLICLALCFLTFLLQEVGRLHKAKVLHGCSKVSRDIRKASKVPPAKARARALHAGIRAVMTVETPYRVWAACMVVCFTLYYSLGGGYSHLDTSRGLSDFGSVAESFGLTVVFHKIRRDKSVAGLSVVTMQMYLCTMTFRLYQVFPGFRGASGSNVAYESRYGYDLLLHEYLTWILCFVSFIQMLAIVGTFFVLYPYTYQKDLDKIKAVPIFSLLVMVAVLSHPTITGGWFYSIVWAANMYFDCAALLPQVVMMASSGDKIKAPIAHFVAATTISRTVDLTCWIRNIRVATENFFFYPNFNAVIIVLSHILGLLLIADFMWYYLKARFVGTALSEDLVIATDAV